MSSKQDKLNVKPSKKERPRSSDKLRKGKRDGTPEKPLTPNASQDALQEEGTPQPERKHVLVNDEILGLAIKPEDLERLHEPQPPSDRRKTPVKSNVIVRKLKPASEWDKPAPKMVTVARPAPPDAPLKPFDPTEGAGLRFNPQGRIVPHSILGSVEDYKTQACKEGILAKELTVLDSSEKEKKLGVKYEKKVRHPVMESVDDSSALRNWQLKMMERKKQQGYLSKLLNKPPEQLVMNQADSYRKTQELRYMVDRTIPHVDYGKGYRVGSEFWSQQERIGNDLTGVHMTLNQTERGYPPPIEHVGVPKTILEEKGTNFSRPNTPFNKPWHKNPYLAQRKEQLQQQMNELDPYQPDIGALSLVGKGSSNKEGTEQEDFPEGATASAEGYQSEEDEIRPEDLDPLSAHPDVYLEPVVGPSILFAGQPARWAGDSSSLIGHVGIEARVTFEAYAGYRFTSFLEIVNDGTTTIYYDWKKLPKSNPFELVNAKVQRFYFNNSSGVILPGDTVKFPFVFKSPNAGVFTEQWEFQTHPVVCNGAALVVTLRGVALQEDKFKKQRSDLEKELAHKQAIQVVTGILDAVIDSIRTTERPQSPVDAFITIDQVFQRKNPGLHYYNDLISELKNIYLGLFSEEEQADQEWDLDIHALKEQILDLDEEDDRKQEFLTKLNSAVISMSFPPFTPAQKVMYGAGYGILCDAVDKMVDQCSSIRSVLGIPDTDPSELDDSKSLKDLPPGKSNDKKGGRLSKGDIKPGDKGKKPPVTPKTPASREAGGPKATAGGKITPATPATKRPSTRDHLGDLASPASGASPIPSGLDPILQAKFREKMYTQTYQLLVESVDKIDEAFSNAQLQEGGPKQLQL